MPAPGKCVVQTTRHWRLREQQQRQTPSESEAPRQPGSSIRYCRKWSKAGPPLSPTRRKPIDACQVHRTERENLVGTGNRKMKLIMQIRNNSMEETYGVALDESRLSYLRRLYQVRKPGSKPVPEWRTSHGSRSENSLKPLRKRSQMVTTYSKHKNEPFQGRNMQERHRNRRGRNMRATILAIWRTRVCVSGGIYRPASF